ncbi:PucR family transcriptional regulator [Agromyces atrinae]|uniref:Purine catabolism regulator n=1 Tax=Agromyces atrinae TaxID=592376 RepID=A0A852S1Q4_9MICO|nr:PucR family transcriptional regulator [Agromyces atrinae]NYD67278.1 purine catabolism regulator [Agromyces atrinae]
MPATLRTVLALPDLALQPLFTETDLAAGALDRPVAWVHSSDLADPTPFLADDVVLLTTGTQFEGAGAGLVADYVERLRARGIVAIGFGTEVVRDGTPDELVAACREAGVPLVEVPYRIPFIAIARAAAELHAAAENARRSWALEAQHRISLAALHPDGLDATFAELARQLPAWVGFFDAAGGAPRQFPSGRGQAADDVAIAALETDAHALLRRGQRASVHARVGDRTVTLQTLGRRGHLRGVLAVAGGEALDPAGRDVVTSVIALAGAALEQGRDLDRARGVLRSGLAHALLADDPAVAHRVADELWGGLPEAPALVAVVDVAADHREALLESLERRSHDVFHALHDDSVMIVLEPRSRAVLEEVATSFDAAVGVGGPADYSALSRAYAQGRSALGRAREGSRGVVDFTSLASVGVLGLLAHADVREVARATLAPLDEHDATSGTELRRTVHVWLENGAQFDAAATALGVHRHTVRARIALAERVLARDLGGFPARADLWAAFMADEA